MFMTSYLRKSHTRELTISDNNHLQHGFIFEQKVQIENFDQVVGFIKLKISSVESKIF